ncbi:MAG TPA: ATP-binding protein [Steroidobacteraceae bacterium]|nr:ATP-binding protein [Steroidobacteraceae bacterium]
MQAIDTPSARSPSLFYWISLVLIPAVYLLAMTFVDRSPQIDPALLRSKFRVVSSDSVQPPPFREDLPPEDFTGYVDYTPVDARNIASVWYQVELDMNEAPRELWAAYFPLSYGTFAVYVNGSLVGESSQMRPPFAYFRTPLYFEFSSSLLRPGTNRIEVHLVSVRYAAFMNPFYLGPAKSIAPAQAYSNFLEVTLVHAVIVALLVMFMLTLGLVWVRPSETGYGWFSAATFCWAAYNWVLIEPRVLIQPAGIWFSLPPIALGWFTICSALFINRMPGCDGPQPRTERGFVAFGVICALAIFAQRLASHQESWIQAYVWLPGLMLINAYIAWRLLLAVRRNPVFEVKLWLLAAVVTLVVGVFDYLSDYGLVWQGSVHYLSYTVSLVLIVFGLTLLSRVTRALTEAETLNRELEDRVAAKGRELEHNYARLQSLERERAISAERERMTTDMHDGIGGQLVHALAVIEGNASFQPLEPILRGALDDLRLIIDSSDPVEGNLLAVLSNFRARNERRVQQSGLRFLWLVTDLPPLPDFGPHRILQVLRVLQEALTNVLKHAAATEVTVRTATGYDASGRAAILVDVTDNGRGYTPSNGPGRGLGNMRRRARELGGTIEFSSSAAGSRVRLILPL